MIRALKVALIAYGVIGILFGLAFIFAPLELGDMFGFERGPEYVPYILALLGACFIAPSVFIIAAARDPLQHISWVKFAILWATLAVVTGSYSIIQGYVDFSQAGVGIILDAVFAAAFLVFYPYRAARGGE
jgi:hypothetical protein